MAKNMGLNLIGCSIVAMVFIIGVTHATDYAVGDSFGWNVPTNESFFKDWASNKTFFLGDKLIFNWTGTHTVAIETEAIHYENCNTSAVSSPFGSSNLNETVFQHTLTQPGPHYYFCTISNHCTRGQKFSINAQSLNSAAPTLSFRTFSLFISTLALFFFTCTS